MSNKRSLSFRCAFLLLAVLIVGLFSAVSVSAEPFIPAKRVCYMTDSPTSYNINLDGVSELSAVTNMKSSKKSIGSVAKFDYMGTVYVGVTPKKTGKTTVTFNYKYKGKSYKGKSVFVFKKYANPFKSLKIGSKKLTSLFKKDFYVTTEKALNGKLSIKLKPGYKLLYISVYNAKDGSGYKQVKNNKSVKIKKGHVLSISVLPKGAAQDEALSVSLRVG